MTPTLEVTEVDRVTADATVCHYDELTGDAKHALPDAVADGATSIRWRAAEQFADLDVVKFTAYYRIELVASEEPPGDARVSSPPTDSRPVTPAGSRRKRMDEPVPR